MAVRRWGCIPVQLDSGSERKGEVLHTCLCRERRPSLYENDKLGMGAEVLVPMFHLHMGLSCRP